MRRVALFAAIFLAVLATSANPRTFRGQIMDSECAGDAHSTSHSHQEMEGIKGNINDRQCTILCVEQGDSIYVMLDHDGKTFYKLSTPQKDLKQYAGYNIVVTGTLDAEGKTITVSKIRRLGATDAH